MFSNSLLALWTRIAEAPRDCRVHWAVRSLRHRNNCRARLLFVCVGNSCRSQMAEAFANAYGGELLSARSAGLEPAFRISPGIRRVMAERGIGLDRHYPKSLHALGLSNIDLIVSLTRRRFPDMPVPVLHFPVPDPIGKDETVHREVRDRIEDLIESVLIQLSRQPRTVATRPAFVVRGQRAG